MNISLPEPLKAFVDAEVSRRGFGSSSEYVRSLIRREHELQALRQLLLEGEASPADGAFDATYFADLRAGISDPHAA